MLSDLLIDCMKKGFEISFHANPSNNTFTICIKRNGKIFNARTIDMNCVDGINVTYNNVMSLELTSMLNFISE